MYKPNYLELYESGELKRRVDEALESLKECKVCPWDCGINRMEDQRKVCRTGRYARVSSFFHHFGEEDPLRGWNGSGTIFLGWCNLRCVFCQNFDISQKEAGEEVTPGQMAAMMLQLQESGCHNINFVTPEHVVPQILEALFVAIGKGLRLPIVYNTSAFDSLHSLKLMDGIVDIYMPDFKYWSESKSQRYLKTPKYPETAKIVIKEMHRQVGDLVLDEKGLARRGILLRHLVMPGGLEDTRMIVNFIAGEISKDTYINIMAQYSPYGKVNEEKYSEINRPITSAELEEAYSLAKEAGLYRFDKKRYFAFAG